MVDNMEWLNVFGLIFIAVIMIPNVVFAIKCKDGFDNKWNNKYVEVTEQVGRLGCFGFMIINIPGTCFGGVWRSICTISDCRYHIGNALLCYLDYMF